MAVVVTYNRCAKLEVTLKRLLETPQNLLTRVIVVDNASTDGTGPWLSAQSEARLTVITMEINAGGAGGFAAGMAEALRPYEARSAASGPAPDWVVRMDDDARPAAMSSHAPGAFEAFLAQDRSASEAWAAAVYYPDGQICDMNRPSVNPFQRPRVFWATLFGALRGKSRDMYHIPHAAYEADTPRPIDITSFVGFFLKGSVMREIGLPDPGLFVYGDDVLYSLRLRKAGHRILFAPDVRFEHDCATFDGHALRLFTPLWKTYYATRNRLFMYRFAAGPLLFWPLGLGLSLAWLLAARRYPPKARGVYWTLLWWGIWDALRKRTDRSHDAVRARAADAE